MLFSFDIKNELARVVKIKGSSNKKAQTNLSKKLKMNFFIVFGFFLSGQILL
jgi:hypothetical protein